MKIWVLLYSVLDMSQSAMPGFMNLVYPDTFDTKRECEMAQDRLPEMILLHEQHEVIWRCDSLFLGANAFAYPEVPGPSETEEVE